MEIKDYLQVSGNYGYIKVKILPKSWKNEFFSIMDDGTLKIRINAIPEKWKANRELISFLSQELWVDDNSIEISSWKSAQVKLIRVKLLD
jgi:uncharacterized protein (TIGR00251 family)